jgi:nicotinamidase-related amidase
VHALANSTGAEFVAPFYQQVKEFGIEIVNTGTSDDGYSAVGGEVIPTNATFERSLQNRKVKKLVIIGMLFDYSVFKTALDAAAILGKKKVTILSNLTTSYSKDCQKVRQKLLQEGIIIK